MAVHRVFADEEPVGDCLVVQSVGDQPENLHLAGRERPGACRSTVTRQRGWPPWCRRTRRARAISWLAPSGVRSAIARVASSAAASGRPSAAITPASSMRARPVSNGEPLSLNRSTASSSCSRAAFVSPERAATRPAARLASARSGAVPAAVAMVRSSANAPIASSIRPCSRHARTINSSAAALSVLLVAEDAADAARRGPLPH